MACRLFGGKALPDPMLQSLKYSFVVRQSEDANVQWVGGWHPMLPPHITGHHLTHWSTEKINANLQMIFSNWFFMNENGCIFIRIPLKFVPKGPINNKTVLVQIMAWRQADGNHYMSQLWPGLLTYICVIRCLWVNWGLVDMGPHMLVISPVGGPKSIQYFVPSCSQLRQLSQQCWILETWRVNVRIGSSFTFREKCFIHLGFV